MSIEDVMTVITVANEWADNIYDRVIPELLGAKDGKIKLGQWFEAQSIIKKIGVYDQNHAAMMMCRKAGYDVKINMQDYKLSYHGMI